MEISLNWLKDFGQVKSTPSQLEEGLTNLGLECTFEQQALGFSNIVLGYVIECDRHPESDHLSVCLVDIGDKVKYQIVCGAPNVRKDIFVPVAKVGAELAHGEFKIKKSKLRGVVSHGMICSGKELNYNEDHEGILIIETNESVGTPIEQVLDFGQDTIFHMDITPNRGDCFSHLGVAREVGILEDHRMNRSHVKIKENSESIADQIKIYIKSPEGCPRYTARIVKNIKVGPSPKWLADKLTSIGQKSINNVVDAANYILMDMGHPMHTFDLDVLSGKEINVRFAEDKEQITTLDGIERTLTTDHLLICDAESPVALAGIMGGFYSGITDKTTSILIESAYFTPTVIRKGSKLLDLSTEASKRFERDTDMDNIIPALDHLADLIVDVAGGEVVNGIIDNYPIRTVKDKITFRLSFCNKLLGIKLEPREVNDIFRKLNFEFESEGSSYIIKVPSYRNDLEREVDIIEEVARVFGYNNIPEANNYSGSFDSFIADDHGLDTRIRHYLSSTGFYEHLSNSLVPDYQLSHFSDVPGVRVKNPLSSEMAYLRNSLIPGLLNAIGHNEKRQQRGFKLFEIGAVHRSDNISERLSREEFQLCLIWHINPQTHWREQPVEDIFRILGETRSLLQYFRHCEIDFRPEKVKGLKNSFSVFYGNSEIGSLGEISSEIQKIYDLDAPVFVCCFSLKKLSKIIMNRKISYTAPSQYPAIQRDIALLVEKSVPAKELLNVIKKVGGRLLTEVRLFDYYDDENLGGNKKSLAYALTFQAPDKNLKNKAVDQIIRKILNQLKSQYNAIQR